MFIFYIIAIAIFLLAMELDFPSGAPFELILTTIALLCICFAFHLIEQIVSWLQKKSPLFEQIYSSYQEKKIIINLFGLLLFLAFLLIGLSF